MILADTSVWIDFFRGRNNIINFSDLLRENQVATHPWIIGELRLGHLGKNRLKILGDIEFLLQLPLPPQIELLQFIESGRLYGHGLSWVDVGLLYAAVTEDCLLWTNDKDLQKAAKKYKIVYPES